LFSTAAIAVAVFVTGASAQDPISNAITARQSMMRLMAFNIGTLGAMAKGARDYDAATAQTAASNLAKVASLDDRAMWPKASDDMSVSHTAAKPEIWTNLKDVSGKFSALIEASAAMDKAAGGGLDALRGAIGPLGKACGTCHKAYRTPKK